MKNLKKNTLKIAIGSNTDITELLGYDKSKDGVGLHRCFDKRYVSIKDIDIMSAQNARLGINKYEKNDEELIKANPKKCHMLTSLGYLEDFGKPTIIETKAGKKIVRFLNEIQKNNPNATAACSYFKQLFKPDKNYDYTAVDGFTLTAYVNQLNKDESMRKMANQLLADAYELPLIEFNVVTEDSISKHRRMTKRGKNSELYMNYMLQILSMPYINNKPSWNQSSILTFEMNFMALCYYAVSEMHDCNVTTLIKDYVIRTYVYLLNELPNQQNTKKAFRIFYNAVMLGLIEASADMDEVDSRMMLGNEFMNTVLFNEVTDRIYQSAFERENMLQCIDMMRAVLLGLKHIQKKTHEMTEEYISDLRKRTNSVVYKSDLGIQDRGSTRASYIRKWLKNNENKNLGKYMELVSNTIDAINDSSSISRFENEIERISDDIAEYIYGEIMKNAKQEKSDVLIRKLNLSFSDQKPTKESIYMLADAVSKLDTCSMNLFMSLMSYNLF